MLNVSDHSATTASQQVAYTRKLYLKQCSYLCKHNVDLLAADD